MATTGKLKLKRLENRRQQQPENYIYHQHGQNGIARIARRFNFQDPEQGRKKQKNQMRTRHQSHQRRVKVNVLLVLVNQQAGGGIINDCCQVVVEKRAVGNSQNGLRTVLLN